MISESPSLFVWSLSEPRPAGIESFLDHHANAMTPYGSGKSALRDGLAGLVEPGENVLIPAYLPDAVCEPFQELGLEIRYYRLEETLAPNLADVERRLDDETAAVMSVNYFGFPQPGLEEFTALLEEYDCYHIDDNAHAPLSVDNGTLLGTRGDLGITSLWKILPIPNGSVLYCNTDAVADALEPSSLAGVSETFRLSDYQFIAKSFALDLLNKSTVVRQSVDTLVAGHSSVSPDPSARYEASKTTMSKLSARVIEKANPDSIRASRRANYRAWLRLFDHRSDVDVLFESLPNGLCPQVFPVRTPNPAQLLDTLEQAGVGGAHTWPRLSSTVENDPTYELSSRLASEVVVLPVHQHIDPTSIDVVGEQLH
ncbi:DegT/DnrJ/EryC1/StrS family aminotransferase [Natronorubrum daqingense]|uniref:Aminotransferase DegT n=1 Tax=Natronorubrum daqingense TaxID=588898 RepID=A0A1N7FGF0_9EURY|nr:DegT/DnrJ/EryC1/StrS family aminotransferase [Natronorubrum daqingense]APX98433.1 aminotransferase DegT [Natronorubrum daqingense]SIR99498.1 dTDP-4-amino-4,6-dideoxygalactose transaminase [Natronorubrum daqingense]